MSQYDPIEEAIAEFESLNPAAYLRASSIDQLIKVARNQWLPFLRSRNVRRDQVAIQDYIAFEQARVKAGRSAVAIALAKNRIQMWYKFLGERMQLPVYQAMADALSKYSGVPVRGGKRPWTPYPLDAIPKILAAAKSYKLMNKGLAFDLKNERLIRFSAVEIKDDWALAGIGVYAGIRSSTAYGLRVSEIDFDERILNVRVKGGHTVELPLHDALASILREHLDTREYESEYVFRYGRNPFSDVTDATQWKDAARSLGANNMQVGFAMRRIGATYKAMYGKADYTRLATKDGGGRAHALVFHRFRDSIGTYGEQFGLTESERRLLLSHGARTITEHYSRANIERVRRKWNLIDLGNAAWVEAHKDGGVEVTVLNGTGGNGDTSKLVARLDKLSEQLSDVLAENKALRAEIVKLKGGEV